MEKSSIFKLIGFSLFLFLPVGFFLYKACHVQPPKEKVTKEIHVYTSDSSISYLRDEMKRMKDDIEYLKRKKSQLTINCIMQNDSADSQRYLYKD